MNQRGIVGLAVVGIIALVGVGAWAIGHDIPGKTVQEVRNIVNL